MRLWYGSDNGGQRLSFKSLYDYSQAFDNGQTLIRSFRKQPTQTTASGIWFDLSMSPGNPAPQYYIGTSSTFTRLTRTNDGGLDHGQKVNALGYKKYLKSLMALTPTSTATPLSMILMDYIGFYGFIDESVTDEQPMNNDVAPSRYADGEGVMLMAVVVAGQTGGQTFTVKYTNSQGVSGRVSQTCGMTTQAVNGTILTSGSTGVDFGGAFIKLQAGDTGVRYVESVTMGGVGDVGLFSLVMVKPLADLDLVGIDAPTEIDYFIDKAGSLPEILDDAYLNFVVLPVGTLSGAPIHGLITTIWG
jgi:hypothetical protein